MNKEKDKENNQMFLMKCNFSVHISTHTPILLNQMIKNRGEDGIC